MLCISKLRSTQFSSTNGLCSSVSLSASILEKSKTSFTMDSSVLPARVTMSMSSTWSPVRPSVISPKSSLPAMMALSGVRISWLVLARKLDLASTAASDRAFALMSIRRDSCSSVTSRTCTSVAGHPSASMGTFVNESSTRRRPSTKSASISTGAIGVAGAHFLSRSEVVPKSSRTRPPLSPETDSPSVSIGIDLVDAERARLCDCEECSRDCSWDLRALPCMSASVFSHTSPCSPARRERRRAASFARSAETRASVAAVSGGPGNARTRSRPSTPRGTRGTNDSSEGFLNMREIGDGGSGGSVPVARRVSPHFWFLTST
mmetsp:Transcript_15882/g.66962  ORF Transcript_15882/g.66962 Transcript_15882/m.66962 type:complete len:320 (-) Transcript_15882:924-1883(-)